MHNIQDEKLWLPTSKKEVDNLGWEYIDIIFFSGDAYVDHPAFGTAIIARVWQNLGFRVAIVPQPNWRDDFRDFKKLGKPRLFFAVSAGNMDSMVNHYTANKRLRSNDAYTPDNKANFRPDYAVTVYTNILKKLFPETLVIIGGIEASLRRLTHYDYWKNELLPSILIDSNADLLAYGMGEKSATEIALRIAKGEKTDTLTNIPQTVYKTKNIPTIENILHLNSYEKCKNDKKKFAENFRLTEEESNKFSPRTIVEPVGDYYIVVNPPCAAMTENEIDAVYDLQFTRMPHPRYKNKHIPAYETIRHSVNIHRGCFGGCSFCTISAHQGKFIVNRSEKSILNEIKKIAQMHDFKGYVSDIGGPSANMYAMCGKNINICKKCSRASCLFPSICKNLNNDHCKLTSIYKKISALPDIKKATIGSGIRYDLFMNENGFLDKNCEEYFNQLVKHHVSGRLKVAPEHTSDKVLKSVRKPSFELFKTLKNKFDRINKDANLNQQIIPYFISCLPHCTYDDMKKLSVETKNLHLKLEQVQAFTPTPMTLASAIYYTGIDPYTNEKVFVARTTEERKKQTEQFFLYKNQYKSSKSK
ncbi:MAG: YgiQ family radical SAM protein [Prevotellaceae bacterium]|jgi:uncharacterized radical SAM protein YgiQ|nr:YgiQ family radical SAM protein [Prevotellaceae bacterium]